jgi:hypothetical protein
MSEIRDRNRYWLYDLVSGLSDGLRLMLLLLVGFLAAHVAPETALRLLLLALTAAAFLTAVGTYFTLKKEQISTPEQRTRHEEAIYSSLELDHLRDHASKAENETSLHPLITPVASAFRVLIFYMAGGLVVICALLLPVPLDDLLTLAIPVGLLLCFATGWLRGWVYGTHRLGEAFRFTFYMTAGIGLLYLIAHTVTA